MLSLLPHNYVPSEEDVEVIEEDEDDAMPEEDGEHPIPPIKMKYLRIRPPSFIQRFAANKKSKAEFIDKIRRRSQALPNQHGEQASLPIPGASASPFLHMLTVSLTKLQGHLGAPVHRQNMIWHWRCWQLACEQLLRWPVALAK